MAPKEKANELVIKFTVVGLQQRNEGIQCALICVDEIIKAIDFDWMEVQNLESHHRFWDSVKEEIELL